MIYNNYNVVQNIYERPAVGGRTERPLLAVKIIMWMQKASLFNHSSKIRKRKLDEEEIDSLSKKRPDYNGCFVK